MGSCNGSGSGSFIWRCLAGAIAPHAVDIVPILVCLGRTPWGSIISVSGARPVGDAVVCEWEDALEAGANTGGTSRETSSCLESPLRRQWRLRKGRRWFNACGCRCAHRKGRSWFKACSCRCAHQPPRTTRSLCTCTIDRFDRTAQSVPHCGCVGDHGQGHEHYDMWIVHL